MAVAVLALGCAMRPAGPAEPAADLEVRASPIEIDPATLPGLRQLGSSVLSANHASFGGFSGLLVENGRLTAVTDKGWLLQGMLLEGPRLGSASFAPLPRDPEDPRKGPDAEGLARIGTRLAVSFERRHRVRLYEGGRLAARIDSSAFQTLGRNEGMEALATLPGGRLLAIAEAPRDGAFPVYVVAPDGTVAEGALPRVERHFVTGADVGPDRRLYLLRRDFSLLAGLSIRVERYWLDEAGFPRPETREVLGSWESLSGIDNMEGIATWATPAGGIRLALISDDNFSMLQRTLLLLFEVTR